VTQAKLMQIDR